LLKRKNLFIVFNLFLILLKIPIKDNQEDHLDGEGKIKKATKNLGQPFKIIGLSWFLSSDFLLSLK